MMVNMTILDKKDIFKYGVKLSILILSIFLATRFLNKPESKKRIVVSEYINKDILLEFVKENIPMMENKNIKFGEKENINSLRNIVNLQIGMINALKEKSIEEKQSGTEESIEHAKTDVETKVIANNVPTKFTNEYNGVKVRNETGYQLTEDMLKPEVTINNKNILIFHTHTCESYTPSEGFEYIQTGTYRTTDNNYNVVRVGTELEKQLKSYGYNVIHSETYHDYPAYNGSYGRSLTTVENLLKQNNNIDVVIDLHRDAIGDYNYAPAVQIGKEEAAQIMFVIGTDGGGLEHENWNDNLKFAIKIQEKANELYPGLFKPIILRNSRYNQHIAKAACIIEVGATGNTMDQCLNSMKYLAKVMSEVMK